MHVTRGVLIGMAMLVAAPAHAATGEAPVRFAIPAQTLAGALDQLARQIGVQILYPYDIAAARRSGGINGRMPARRALDRLLRRSGLEIATFGGKVISLRVARPATVPPSPAPRATPPRQIPLPVPAAEPPRDIVVTGRAAEAPLRETELSYAITRIDAAALSRQKAISTADLFKQIPGFWVEATGGEASNNVRARGIPTDGYSTVALLEDGLPVQYDGGLGYLNTDQIFRIDATIDQVEAVRGGPSAIFAPNAPGGSVDFITRNGLKNPGYTLSGTLGSFGYARIDGFAGLQLAPTLGVSIGGFYRADNGLRDPGYPADRGGQIRAGIDYDDGRLRLSFNVKRLDDRVILYLPVPLEFDARGQVRAIPGFDPLRDTLAGPDNAHVLLKTPNGPYDFDLTQGTRSHVTFYSLAGRLALGERTLLEVRTRLRTGTTLRNGLFPTGRPMPASAYLDSVHTQLAAAFPNSSAVQIRFAGTAQPFAPNNNGNGLVLGANLLSVALPMDEFIGDARLKSVFDLLGHHDAAVGLTYGDSRWHYDRQMATALLEVSGRARRLDVVAIDPAGRDVGRLTDNGFIRYGSLFDSVAMKTANVALYLADEWAIAPHWRVDLGLRWERTRIGGDVMTSRPFDLGDPTTLADDAVIGGTGVTRPIDRRFAGLNWTTAINFNPFPSLGLFARLTRIARLPSASEFYASPNRTDEAIVPITMAEAGLIATRPRWNLSAVGFATHFARLPFTDYRFDTVSNSYVERTSIADTSTIGLELAGHAELIGPLQLDMQATLQDPRYRNFSYVELSSGQSVTRNVTGNRLVRVPRLSLRLAPSLNLFRGKLRISGELMHYSSRFADIANTQRLPAFSLLNASLNAKLNDRVGFALNATNLTNALGLTEGNPRVGSFDAGGMSNGYFLARPEFGRSIRGTLSLSY
ncbi:TonB-dependent receptor [Sphingomonas sp. MMSM20]|nr:TonB-dependent receptor [Sphingomonas lycopersici]